MPNTGGSMPSRNFGTSSKFIYLLKLIRVGIPVMHVEDPLGLHSRKADSYLWPSIIGSGVVSRSAR
jgi:hypothetical protein